MGKADMVETRCSKCLGYGDCSYCDNGKVLISEENLEKLELAREYNELINKYGDM